jgi:hypothetical protein
MSWATFGCSFTQYKWYTWADFLKISVNKCKNFGLPGSSNEFISRQILKNYRNYKNIVVMWSGYDRIHNDYFLKLNGFNSGRYSLNDIPLEQLMERSLEYIWLANKVCKENNVSIHNFSITMFNIGESKKIITIPNYLDVDIQAWPIDMTQYCIENPSNFRANTQDGHPLPSEHYSYFKTIMCPVLEIDAKYINNKVLATFDKNAVDNN